MKGKFVVIVGPSAVGKTILVEALVRKMPNSTRLVTMTTRARRPQEKEGRNYFFISRDEFEKKIKEGEFFEYAEVYGNYYGSSKKVLDACLENFAYTFAVIDVQGARTLKSKIPDAFVVFIRPGSIDDLKKRLEEGRAGTPPEEMKKRIETALYEVSLAPTFDAVVENIEGRFEETVAQTIKILESRN